MYPVVTETKFNSGRTSDTLKFSWSQQHCATISITMLSEVPELQKLIIA